MIWIFGDSWAEGFGLKDGEKKFSDFLSEHYQSPVTNLGLSASSMGHITSEIFKNSDEFKYSDVLICVIPPDTRWYNIDNNYNTHSLFNGMPEYGDFLKLFNTTAWFTYHHSLFIYAISQLAKQKRMKCLLMHNYGKLELLPNFEFLIGDVFLDRNKSLCHYLSGKEEWQNNLTVDVKNGMNRIEGKYFIPNDNHPNEEGHKFIANLIIERFANVHTFIE